MSTTSLPRRASPAAGAPRPGGDGERTAGASGDQVVTPRLRDRLRPWRSILLAAAVLLVTTLIAGVLTPDSSEVDMAVNNPRPGGAQALAHLLEAEGVSVSTGTSVDGAIQDASSDPAGTTIALVNAGELTEGERTRLASTGADVVVVGSRFADLSGLGPVTSVEDSADDTAILRPACQDADAVAAASVAGSRGAVLPQTGSDAVGCFPVGGGDRYAYVTAPLGGGATLRVIADASIATNARLTEAGHAALTVRSLGHRSHVIWLDAAHLSSAGSLWRSPSVPPWLPVLGAQALVVGAVAALALGRRFGRLVPEDLPVVVRSTETTVGRGRLYRQAGDRERASQALRAGAAVRLGRRLGLPAAAGRGELVAAVAAATGAPEPVIDRALYGAAPSTDEALADLAVLLDRIENEVHAR